MIKKMKTAITLSKEDYELIEIMRKETGKSRSEILMDAFRESSKARRMKEKEAQYAEGYRLKPETKEDIQEISRISDAERTAWPKEKW